MNFNQLEAVLAVADAGSFMQAARRMGVTPQSVMQQVGAVERELGFEVFRRSSRGAAPTDAGAAFCAGARDVVELHRRTVKQAQSIANRSRSLRVGIPSGVTPTFLLSVCAAFAAAHPEATITHVSHKPSEMADALTRGEIDLCMEVGSEETATPNSSKLFDVLLYCVVSHRHPLASCTSVAPEQLAGVPLAVWEAAGRYRSLFRRFDTPSVVDLHRDIGAALSLCINGGILVTSMPAVQLLKNTLAAIPLACDTGIHYSVSCRDLGDPLIADFVRIARKLGTSKDNTWFRQHEELMAEMEARRTREKG